MAWMDPEWPDRDQRYRDKLKAEGYPRPPDTPASRTLTRVALIVFGVTFGTLLGVLLVVLILR
jgi:hypothetical protein